MENTSKLLLFCLAIIIVGFILVLSLDNKKIKTIWKNRRKIWEGMWNTYFPNAYVERIAKRRLAICKSNVCELYDPVGAQDICVKKGYGCCTGCGCNDLYKVHSLTSYCTLKDLGQEPLWEAEMTQKEQKEFEEKTGYVNKHND